MRKEKIVVTAPTSILAKNFIRSTEDQYDIITLGRRESDIRYDFCNREKLSLPEGVSSIVHFAGILRDVDDKEILNMVDVNVRGILEICKAAKESKIGHVINVSSINATLSKESPHYGYYSLTKRQGEEIANLFCKIKNIRLCNIRPSQVFGCDKDYSKRQPLFYLMINNAKSGKDICIYGKNDAIRNYIYSDNLFNLIKKVIEEKHEGTIDAIDEHNYKLSDVAKMIINAYKCKSKIRFLQDKPDLNDNGFYTDRNFFMEWNIPFVDLSDAITKVKEVY